MELNHKWKFWDWEFDASSSDQSGSIQVQGKQKARIFDKDQASLSKVIHSIETTILVIHIGKEEVATNK